MHLFVENVFFFIKKNIQIGIIGKHFTLKQLNISQLHTFVKSVHGERIVYMEYRGSYVFKQKQFI